ncbi:DUF1003 domain-containing protein [Aurantimonas sp. Leaf443]|uniref:DUF1003 domain-containing protein n=1 Tax=Aurantimonas sp. Leaf443 TaxID=1736378 RepID=UPI0006F41764|nr:DUF1003 domain-containing protein [Aurantimonas sp. Leaf443]KQT86216.1 cyclic nucleotide-binding protein [Aurantimonas sp. Leaf443]
MTTKVHDEEARRRFGRPYAALGQEERRVLDSARAGTTIATDVSERIAADSTFGQRVSDEIARIGGSWTFILCFLAFLVLWAVVNVTAVLGPPFDPYPFIFLNLILSMVAAIQAPIIMMSQNRAAERDRRDMSHDYEVNLKAEIEILALHDKLDAMRRDETDTTRMLLAEIAERLGRIEARLGRGDGADPR